MLLCYGVESSSSANIDNNNKKDIWILRIGPRDELDYTTEAEYKEQRLINLLILKGRKRKFG